MKLGIQKQVDLAKLTSWQIGGPAEFFCAPRSIEEVKEAIAFADREKLAVTVLGGGSNVLVADAGIAGLTICLQKLVGTEIQVKDGRLVIQAMAGSAKSELLRAFLKEQLAPAMFLAGLPGDVGGGIVMNAGVAENLRPREFHEIVDWIEVLKSETELVRYSKSDIDWSYRHSSGWQPGIIVRAQLSWPMEADPEVLKKVKELNKIRLSKQPLLQPSCGSVFVNPPRYKAAQLIEATGLKGHSIGQAQVSEKHSNFIVNLGGAKASDVDALIKFVQARVLQAQGILLKTEVVYLGRWSQ